MRELVRASSVSDRHPALNSPEFQFVKFDVPADSGRRVWLSSFLDDLVQPSEDRLIWLGSWDVWPSSRHLPLFDRLRGALGESRPLAAAPGSLASSDEREDAISVVCVALLFTRDCHILSNSGRDAVCFSHDEYGWFASRDVGTAAIVRTKLEDVGLKSTAAR